LVRGLGTGAKGAGVAPRPGGEPGRTDRAAGDDANGKNLTEKLLLTLIDNVERRGKTPRLYP
jgi:hypothetical protein